LKRSLTRWLPPLLWSALIFGFSADTSSAQHSSRFFGPLIRWLFPHFTEAQVDSAVFLMRKIAHVTVYAVLAILVWCALEEPSWRSPQAWRWSSVALTLGIVIAYAVTDEIHQAFVPTRQGSPIDVLIDTAGGLLGLLLYWAAQKVTQKILPSSLPHR
jgi:VanZ family protein